MLATETTPIVFGEKYYVLEKSKKRFMTSRFSPISRKHYLQFKSSQRRCSIRKGVPRNFTKFTGRHLCQSLFFNKVAGLQQLF